MKNDLNLTDILIDLFSSFDKKVENSGLVSICVEIPCIDLFQIYELLINQYPFSSFWEESDGISYIAFEKCKYVTLDGPKRFEVAKEFNSENFKNLINLTNESHNSALSKIIYLFSFSENLNNKTLSSDIPSLEAILPKILIISHPTWGIDAGAEHSIRESLIELSQNGTSIIVISQDLDELIEITHKISVIYDGNLSKPFKTSEVGIEKLGLLMGGKNE